MMIVNLTWCGMFVLQSLSLPHKNNMMVTALMLCGIKSDVINYYNQIMGYFSAVTEDLALFIFTFLLAHMFTWVNNTMFLQVFQEFFSKLTRVAWSIVF